MEEEVYVANTTLYAEAKDVAKLKPDSNGRVVFRTGKKNSYHFVCKKCGEKRYIRPSDIARGRGIYCTMKCFHANDNPRVEFVCPVCGTRFSVEYNKAKKFKTHYCSKKCYDEIKSELVLPIDITPSAEMAYILGVIVGDGCCNVYTKNWKGKERKSYDIRLSVINYAFARSFADALEKIGLHPNVYLGKKPKYRGKNEQRLWNTNAYSKTFTRFYRELRNTTGKLKDFVETCPEGGKEFIRGFFESEGHVGRYKYKRVVGIQNVKHLHMTNTDKELVELVIDFTKKLGYHPYTSTEKRGHLGRKDKVTIHLPPKEHNSFLELIRPVIKNKKEKTGIQESLGSMSD